MTKLECMTQEVTLYLGRDMTAPESVPVAGGEAVVFTTRSPDKETSNEDGAAIVCLDEHHAVLTVADGLGGGPAGERAAGLALEAVGAAVAEARVADADAELRSAMVGAFDRANAAVMELGVGAATTLAVVEITAGTIRPYHAGDSMILAMGLRGRLKLQTISHSPLGYAVEAGVLEEKEAIHHEERHVVSNVIGAADMRIEIGPTLKLSQRDTVLLATDGLFDNLHLEEIVETVRKGPLAKAVAALAARARARMLSPDGSEPSKPDDLTIIAFRQGAPTRKGPKTP